MAMASNFIGTLAAHHESILSSHPTSRKNRERFFDVGPAEKTEGTLARQVHRPLSHGGRARCTNGAVCEGRL